MPSRVVLQKHLYALSLALVILCPAWGSAQDNESELRSLLASAKTDTARARLSGELAWRVKFINNDEAFNLAGDEIKWAPEDALRLADAYRTQALVLVIENKIPEGMNLYALCLDNARKAHSTFYEASCFSLMAGMYQDMGDYDQSLHYYFEGLKASERGNDKRMTGTLCNNIASVYSEAGMAPELSLRFFNRALQEANAVNNFAFAELITANMASEYIRAGKKDSAEIMVRVSSESGRRSAVRGYEHATALANIGEIYTQLNKPKEAEQNLRESMDLLDSLKRPINVMGPMSALCDLYIKQNDIPQAQILSERLLHDALRYHTKPFIRDGYKAMSDIARKRNQDAVALDYYDKYSAWNDSVSNDTKAKSIANVQSRAELAQKELEVQYETKKKTTENELLKLQNNNLGNVVIAVVLALLLIVVLVFFVWRDKRYQERTNHELSEKNKRIEQQSKEKDTLMQEIHHRVKNNLQIVSSLLNLQSNAIQDEAAKEALKESLNRVNSIALIHQKLYQQDDISAISLEEYIAQLSVHLKNVFNANPVEILCRVSPADTKLDMETSIPLGVILNELITNSIKYAGINHPGGQIKIEIASDKTGMCTLRFSDNGMGMPDDFDIRRSSTLGLRMVSELSRQLKGTLTYTKSPESAFIIAFPLSK